jgi:hypothetical protein
VVLGGDAASATAALAVILPVRQVLL